MKDKNTDKESEIVMYFVKKSIEEDRRPPLKKISDKIKHDFKVLKERFSPIN